ncbi:hypothetical protein [Blastococcus sp. SYSU DS0533]
MTRSALAPRLAPLVAALVAALVVCPVLVVAAPAASAADARAYPAGNIISDALFFDGGSMDVGQVQTFLDQRGSGCTPAPDGTPCLKDYRQDTGTRAADAYCAAYQGAPAETAAQILVKVGRACGINPRVLLVMLQKEQSLVTMRGGTTKLPDGRYSLNQQRYEEALGYGCPDTAPCDPSYKGLALQVYSAARKFRVYAANPNSYNHKAGRTQAVRYHPNTACGSGQVYIQNVATAGLYNYTPYQPNAAALDAGYQSGDGCSAYGNRNFWLYYTDWFGSTQSPGGAAIADKWASLGGATGLLGDATSTANCTLPRNGCYQLFSNGALYWSPGTGAHFVKGDIWTQWARLGYEGGFMGYPVRDETNVPGGTYSVFEGGAFYWSPATGTHYVKGDIWTAWGRQGYESGPLGFPKTDEVHVPGGAYSEFTGGRIYWSPGGGAHAVTGAFHERWSQLGGHGGFLGFPHSGERATADGSYVAFAGGALYRSSRTGMHFVKGAIQERWARAGYEAGALGYPVADEQSVPGGTFSLFERGGIYWSPGTGARALTGELAREYAARGGPTGPLGFPATDQATTATRGAVAHFRGGSLYWSAATGAHAVSGPTYAAFAASGWENGPLGYPTADATPLPGGTGTVTTFEHGAIYWSRATGAHAVTGAIESAWNRWGGTEGELGLPGTDVLALARGTDGRVQHFQGGSVYSSRETGTRVVKGAVYRAWAATGWEQGFLGYPVSDETHVPGGAYNLFQGGAVYWSPATGAHAIRGKFYDAWARSGYEGGSLGFPASGEYDTRRGRQMDFQHGTVLVTTAGQVEVTVH